MDDAAIARLVAGRRVLITGAGGSIGSELARRCAEHHPALLVLVERSENALFEINRSFVDGPTPVRAILHDVVHERATRRVVREHRPDVVFHAAAHKHVPMMEDHPAAAVENNVFGTRSIADAALAEGVDRFVMVSTDKAVNPRSVMGATKRLAERYVRRLATQNGRTSFRIVRFGNVLGSACSVLPIWGAQLAKGGPITVTDPDMTRYFMTIPEAASLVIQAAALDERQDRAPVYVLDMGEPVRIGDLAERFVHAWGLEPAWEPGATPGERARSAILIRITGARPGEKKHEELAHAEEELEPSGSEGILMWQGGSASVDTVDAMIEDLRAALAAESPRAVLRAIARHLPEFSVQKPNIERAASAA